MSFKKYCIIALLIFISSTSYSQQAEDLLGVWKVVKVGLQPNAQQEEKQMLEMLNQTFLKSTFYFKENNLFSFDSPNKDLAIKAGFWKFDSNKKFINVAEPVSKGVPGQLMGITVKVLNNEYSFWLDETPLVLTVKKKEG